jgi:hypothetical protein
MCLWRDTAATTQYARAGLPPSLGERQVSASLRLRISSLEGLEPLDFPAVGFDTP